MEKLTKWLAKVEARQLWTQRVPHVGRIDCYQIGKGIALVQIFKRGGRWRVDGVRDLRPRLPRESDRWDPRGRRARPRCDVVKAAGPPPGSTPFGTISIYTVPGGYVVDLELRHDSERSEVHDSPQAAIAEVVNRQTVITPGTADRLPVVERACEVCGAEAIRGCTNKRCSDCHGKWCTSGGSTTPGHGRKWPPGVDFA